MGVWGICICYLNHLQQATSRHWNASCIAATVWWWPLAIVLADSGFLIAGLFPHKGFVPFAFIVFAASEHLKIQVCVYVVHSVHYIRVRLY
jgi:hypothetical protein